ncbi:MAG: hypothetical protein J5J00_02180 [Deltaproteobacteria bacterium]|nr:hypothetical protein [Deltaproteobacteria bacterium]
MINRPDYRRRERAAFQAGVEYLTLEDQQRAYAGLWWRLRFFTRLSMGSLFLSLVVGVSCNPAEDRLAKFVTLSLINIFWVCIAIALVLTLVSARQLFRRAQTANRLNQQFKKFWE